MNRWVKGENGYYQEPVPAAEVAEVSARRRASAARFNETFKSAEGRMKDGAGLLDGIMYQAQKKAVLHWALDQNIKLPSTAEEAEELAQMFFSLPCEQREMYRARPTRGMVQGASDWLEHKEAKQWHALWGAYGKYYIALRDRLLEYEDDYDVVDDLVMDVAARAAETAHQFEARNDANIKTWLYTVADTVGKNHVRSTQRDKRKYEMLEVYMPGEDDEGFNVPYYDQTQVSTYAEENTANLDPLLEVEAEDTYADALSRMPKKMAAVVQLRREGTSNSLIAEELSVKEKTVRNLVHESSNYFRDNHEVTVSNRLSERDEGNALRRPRSCADVERAQRERFFRRDSALRKRNVRMASPEASTAEWKEQY